MQRIYLAIARQDATPVERRLADLPGVPFDSQWATFLRNHDELTLDQLSDDERQEVFDAFGPDPEMQLYGRGLRRRLPPMLGGDQQRIRMAYSLLFSLPGTPVLFYGEEIGMGENLDVDDRLAVRTPMQWSDEPGAGSDRRCQTVPPPGPRGRVPAARCERRCPAAGPGITAQLVRAIDPPPARDARARPRHVVGHRQ